MFTYKSRKVTHWNPVKPHMCIKHSSTIQRTEASVQSTDHPETDAVTRGAAATK